MKDREQMIKYICLTIISYTLLCADAPANTPAKITTDASCYDARSVLSAALFSADPRKEKFTISLSSKKLDQSKDAIHSNTDGYVDTTEEKYALISGRESYRLDGTVIRERSDNRNRFVSDIYSDAENTLDTKTLQRLKNSKELKLIQQINLSYKSDKTNTVDVYFDEESFTAASRKCEAQVQESQKRFYLQLALLILATVLLLYLLRRGFRR